MSSIDIFFDTDKISRAIPCDIPTTRDLRTAAHDCRPEIGRIKVDPNAGSVRAYTHDDSIVYVFNCVDREGDCAIAIAQVLIGLGCYAQSLFDVPPYLTNKHVASGDAFWLEIS